MADEKKVVLTEEDLELINGGGLLDKAPKVKEHDYDEEVEDKVGGD